jgi:hypothetical protein
MFLIAILTVASAFNNIVAFKVSLIFLSIDDSMLPG